MQVRHGRTVVHMQLWHAAMACSYSMRPRHAAAACSYGIRPRHAAAACGCGIWLHGMRPRHMRLQHAAPRHVAAWHAVAARHATTACGDGMRPRLAATACGPRHVAVACSCMACGHGTACSPLKIQNHNTFYFKISKKMNQVLSKTLSNHNYFSKHLLMNHPNIQQRLADSGILLNCRTHFSYYSKLVVTTY